MLEKAGGGKVRFDGIEGLWTDLESGRMIDEGEAR